MLDRRQFLTFLPASLALSAEEAPLKPAHIRRIDIIHHSHTDVGYTDLPSVTRDLQKRYLDAAIDACERNPSFHWTAEAILTVDDWWHDRPAGQRERLVSMVRSCRMDIMALPFNQTPFQNAMQWDQMVSWLPPDVWRSLNPRAAMQNDVNGFPRAGAMRLLDKGIRHLLMGINADSGGPPFRRPSAFWWKMPDGRRIFVWLGDHYGTAFSYFEAQNWIRGGRAENTALGPPRPGDVLRTDEQSLRASHAHLLSRLSRLEADGYDYPTLLLSYTNQWRYDNDPPFPPLANFVNAWNRLDLQPPLRFTTATAAVFSMEKEIGARVRTLEGEWTDWWANGDASGPRELAASRVAKRKLIAAFSPVWGPSPESARPSVEKILKDLCLFDEHTWGADSSIREPDGIETIGQYTEKSLLAHRPRAAAEWLLSRRARTKLDPMPEGLYVVNTTREPWCGWARFSSAALRDDFVSAEDHASGAAVPIQKQNDIVSFWVESLGPGSVRNLRLSKQAAVASQDAAKPSIDTDDAVWPVRALWPGMAKSLIGGETAGFVSVGVAPPGNRSSIVQMHEAVDPGKREELRLKYLVTANASYDKASVEETPHTLVYTQPVVHPRLADAWRRIELFKREPRARVTFHLNRVSSRAPEVMYIAFGFPVEGVMPVFSAGGVPFTPYLDQLEGSCRDYYAIDGWAHYATPAGDWMWVTRDAALVSVGGPHTLERRTTAPGDTHRLLAMIFDNCWHTNFVADSHGEMDFRFELAWRPKIANPGQMGEALAGDPVVMLNSATRESPELLNNLFRP
jgi:hypothetical protein